MSFKNKNQQWSCKILAATESAASRLNNCQYSFDVDNNKLYIMKYTSVSLSIYLVSCFPWPSLMNHNFSIPLSKEMLYV